MPDGGQNSERLNMLETLLSAAFDPMCVLDGTGRLLRWNQPWEDYADNGVLQNKESLFDALHFLPEHKKLCETFAEACKAREPRNLTLRQLAADGTAACYQGRFSICEPWILFTLHALPAPAPTRMVANNGDDNLNDFMDSIDDLVFITDEQARVLHTNAAVTAKLGYTAGQLAGVSIYDIHPLPLRQEARMIFQDMLDRKRETCPLPILRIDGAQLPVETSVRFGQWRGVTCIYGISRDISAQQAANQKFRKFFDSNPALMAVTSLSTSRFVEVNQAFLDTLGYNREDVIGKTSRKLNLFLDPELHAKKARELISRGDIPNLELVIRHRDGHQIVGLFSATYIEHLGETSLLSVMVNVTAQKAAERLLQQRDRLIKQMMNAIPDQICFTDAKGCFQAANRSFAEKYMGVSEAEIIGKKCDDLYSSLPKNAVPLLTEEESGQRTATTVFEHELTMADESRMDVETVRTPLYAEDGRLDGMISVSRDITARRESERKLRASEMRLNLATESAHVVIWDWNPQTGKAILNDQWKILLSMTDEQAKQLDNVSWRTLIHPDDLARSLQSLENHLKGQTDHFENEVRVQKPNGDWLWMLHRGSAVEWDQNHQPLRVTGTLIDITQRKQAEQQLARNNRDLQEAYAQMKLMATTDALTGLLNRREIIRRMELEANRYCRTRSPFSVILADIDHFKQVNDRYRHQAGDAILTGLTALFQQNMRCTDCVARWGGEEFLFLLPDTAAEAAVILAERIRKSVETTLFSAQDQPVSITVSFGVSSFREDQNIDSLLDQADSALYRSKENGRNQISVFREEPVHPE